MALSTYSSFFNVFDKLRGRYSMPMDNTMILSVAYIAYKAKLNNISLKQNSIDILNQLYNQEAIPNLLTKYTFDDLSFCDEYSCEEIKGFIESWYDKICTSSTKENMGISYIPFGIINLATKILEVEENDKLLSIGDSALNFPISFGEKYSSNTISALSVTEYESEVLQIISDVKNIKVNILPQNFFTDQDIQKHSKILCVPVWNCDISHWDTFYGISKRPVMKNSIDLYIALVRSLLTYDGKAIVCVPLSYLNKDNKFLIGEIPGISAVITIAGGLFYSTTVKSALLVISKKEVESIRFVNATEIFSKTRKLCNELSDSDVLNIYNAYLKKSEFSTEVSLHEIAEKNYSMNPLTYLNSYKIIIPGLPANTSYQKILDVLLSKPVRGAQIKSDTLDEESFGSNYRYITQKNIVDNEIEEDIPSIPEQNNKLDKYCLNENDIVLSLVTTDVIKVALAKNLGNLKIIASNMLYILRPNPEIIDPVYLKAILETEYTSKIFKTFSSGTGAISTLSIDTLCQTEIPVLPLAEQQIYVSKYEKIYETKRMLKDQLSKIEKAKELLFITTFQGR